MFATSEQALTSHAIYYIFILTPALPPPPTHRGKSTDCLRILRLQASLASNLTPPYSQSLKSQTGVNLCGKF
jgi:hypothetical protein